MEKARANDLLEAARTGDLVLFSGRGLVSGTIRVFTGSRWSHVGLVLRGDDGELFMLEATNTDEAPDVTLGRAIRGVQVVRLVEKLANYDGVVALRRLEVEARPEGFDELVRDIAELWRYRAYKDFTTTLLLDLLSANRRPHRVDRVFCSELVAEIYKRLGIMCRSVRSSRYVPGDFGRERPGFLREARLSEPVFLKAS